MPTKAPRFMTPEEATHKLWSDGQLNYVNVDGNLVAKGVRQVNLRNATINGTLELRDFGVSGDIYLNDSQIREHLLLSKVIVGGSLMLHGINIGGNLYINDTKVCCGLHLDKARIKGGISLHCVELDSLSLHAAEIDDWVSVEATGVRGDISLREATIGGMVKLGGEFGDLDLNNARLKKALDLRFFIRETLKGTAKEGPTEIIVADKNAQRRLKKLAPTTPVKVEPILAGVYDLDD